MVGHFAEFREHVLDVERGSFDACPDGVLAQLRVLALYLVIGDHLLVPFLLDIRHGALDDLLRLRCHLHKGRLEILSFHKYSDNQNEILHYYIIKRLPHIPE